MSLRQMFAGSIVKPGFNALGVQTTTTFYDLYGWGANAQGQLGLGNTTAYSSPVQVGATSEWASVSVSSGSAFAAALKPNGTLWMWGYNAYGQLGNGNLTNYSSPIQVGALTTWLSVTCGQNHTGAVKTDGTLWMWGANNNGQLGQGNTTYRSSPVQVGLLSTWLNVAAGYKQTIALKTDGTMWSWGSNNVGQLGLGNLTSYSSPKQIGALTTWSKISTSAYLSPMTYALKTDGTLWTWGANNQGGLGLGNTTNYSSPKQIGALTTWSKVTAGYQTAANIKTDGTLWTWGYNNRGQLGIGNITNYSSPKQVGSLTNWYSTSLGASGFTLATKTDGSLWSWGYNSDGQLGLGNTTQYSSPKQVGAVLAWSTVAAMIGASLALR